MQRYVHSSGFIDLGTDASGSAIWSITNPLVGGVITAPGNRWLILKKLHFDMDFAGVPAAARISLGFGRATGTPAGGSGVSTPANTGHRNPLADAPLATVNFGPVPITGFTPDGVGDMMTTGFSEQLTSSVSRDLVAIEDNPQGDSLDLDNNWVLSPGTSFVVWLRTISIAGVGIAIDSEWSERKLSPYTA